MPDIKSFVRRQVTARIGAAVTKRLNEKAQALTISTPVKVLAAPVKKIAEPVKKAAEPVRKAAEPFKKAAVPVKRAAVRVRKTAKTAVKVKNKVQKANGRIQKARRVYGKIAGVVSVGIAAYKLLPKVEALTGIHIPDPLND